MADLSSTIETAAGQPQEVTVDGQTVKAHDLDKLIEADRYLAQKSASAQKTGGLRFVKLSQPSAV